jgi:hypothetical protein
MFGQSLSTLLRFRQSPLKFGILLALAAWLMQLSVFLTPILSHQLSIGYGVCEELAVFSQSTQPKQLFESRTTTHSTISHATMSHAAMSGMSMAEMSDMSDMDMSYADPVPAQISQHKADSHAPPTHSHSQSSDSTPAQNSHHALCHFCTLFGHSVLPPFQAVIPLATLIAMTVSSIQINAFIHFYISQNKTLRPQGRAPPQFIL